MIGDQMQKPDVPSDDPNVDLTFRLAKPDDAPAIQAMIRALAETTGALDRVSSDADDVRQHGFGRDPLFECLLAERGDVAVGLCLYFYTYSSWLGEPGVYVQDLYVTESERGGGVGRQLLATVASTARARNATHLRLSVEADNRSAAAFYESIGMEHRDQELTYHLGGSAFTALTDSSGDSS